MNKIVRILIIIILVIGGLYGLLVVVMNFNNFSTINASNVTNNPKFEVLNNNLTIVKNSTYQVNGSTFMNATIKNIGNSTIPVLGIEVNFENESIGSFIINNLTSQEEKTFSMKISKDGLSFPVITDSNGNNIDQTSYRSSGIYYEYDGSHGSSINPRSYKFLIGKQDANTSLSQINNIIIDFARKNNGTSQSDSIIIKGDPVYDNNDITPYPLNHQFTFFIVINKGKGYYIGEETYESGTTTKQIPVYNSYVEIMAIYWPEMKIAGVSRVYSDFTTPYSVRSDSPEIVVEYPGYSEIMNWIKSLPKE